MIMVPTPSVARVAEEEVTCSVQEKSQLSHEAVILLLSVCTCGSLLFYHGWQRGSHKTKTSPSCLERRSMAAEIVTLGCMQTWADSSLVLSLKLLLWICCFCFFGLLCSIRTAIKKYLRYGALIQSKAISVVEFQMLWQIDGSNRLG